MFKKEKGITLVALVVTIIVLIILAAVTISLAMSGGGLFQKAKEATDNWTAQEEYENEILSNEYITNYINSSI